MAELGVDGGWIASAQCWIDAMAQQEDPNRTLLLDPVVLDVCGGVGGKLVLDLGCGEGRFCRMLDALGATTIGLDLVAAMVATARNQAGVGSAYCQATAEAMPFRNAVFDLAVSYVTLVDIADFRAAIAEAARVLKPGGSLVVANLGFVTASTGWQRDEQGRRLYHRVDHYAGEWSRIDEWGDGIRIRNWHRPLSAYMEAYLGAGFELRRFLEPVPKDESLKDDPSTEDWFRVPLFNVMHWEKK